MKKKLSLKELEVKSFVTSLHRAEAIKSGIVIYSNALFALCVSPTEDAAECPPTHEIPKQTDYCNKTTILNKTCNNDTGGLVSGDATVCMP